MNLATIEKPSKRILACREVTKVLNLCDPDPRSVNAVKVAMMYAGNQATQQEATTAKNSAMEVVRELWDKRHTSDIGNDIIYTAKYQGALLAAYVVAIDYGWPEWCIDTAKRVLALAETKHYWLRLDFN